MAALFHVLAMGARVFWDPKFEMGVFKPHLHPFIWPPFHETRHVNERYAMGTALCIRIAASYGVKRLSEKNRWAPLVALGVFIVESIALSPSPWPVPHSNAGLHPISKELANAKGAILDMPRQYNAGRTFVGDILVQQMYHQRPIPYSMDEKPDPMPVVIEGRHLLLFSHQIRWPTICITAICLPWYEAGRTCTPVMALMSWPNLVFQRLSSVKMPLSPNILYHLVIEKCLRPGTRADGRQIFCLMEWTTPKGLNHR